MKNILITQIMCENLILLKQLNLNKNATLFPKIFHKSNTLNTLRNIQITYANLTNSNHKQKLKSGVIETFTSYFKRMVEVDFSSSVESVIKKFQ